MMGVVRERDQKPENRAVSSKEVKACHVRIALLCHTCYTVIYTGSKGQQILLKSNNTLDWQHFMYIPLSHFDLALMTTPGVAQQRIRRTCWFPKLSLPKTRAVLICLHMRYGHFVQSGKAMTHLTPLGAGQGAVSWTACSSAQHCCVTLPAHSCHFVCICVLYLPHVWVPTARPAATANQLCFAEIHQPRELFQLTQDEASGALRGRAVFVPYLCPDQYTHT